MKLILREELKGGITLFKKKIAIIIILIIICIYFYPYTIPKFNLYGDDQESIIKTIQEIESYEDVKRIEILKIMDFKNERVVAYLYKNGPGFIQFTKDSSEHYYYSYSDRSLNGKLHPFEPYIIDVKGEKSTKLLLIVSNANHNVTKLKVKIDDEIIEKNIKAGKKTASITTIPKSKDDSYDFKYEHQ